MMRGIRRDGGTLLGGVRAKSRRSRREPISTGCIPHTVRRLLGALSLAAAAVVTVAMLPGAALASLPDNRIWEQVSPPDNNGNIVFPQKPYSQTFETLLASETGNAVIFETTGGVGKVSDQGFIQENVARFTPGVGWRTEPADPRQLTTVAFGRTSEAPGFYPSRDFSRIVFDTSGPNFRLTPYNSEEPENGTDLKLYMSESPLVEPLWLGKPAIANSKPELGGLSHPEWSVAGVAPDAKTGYFTYTGTLLPEDESSGRSQHVLTGGVAPNTYPPPPFPDAVGFYEWAPGPAGEEVKEAGVLPSGKISAYGAKAPFGGENFPPNSLDESYTEAQNNQVSQDGTRALFVSPLSEFSKVANPAGCEGAQTQQEEREKEEFKLYKTPELHIQACTDEAPELYVREALANGEHRTTLVSRSESSQPAPTGVKQFGNAPGPGIAYEGYETDAYAPPDGSRVFFSSSDALTSAAPQRTSWFVNLACYGGGQYTGGHFKLSVTAESSTQTTAPIKWGASEAEVQKALEALSNVGAGNVEATPTGCGVPFTYQLNFTKLADVGLSLDTTELEGEATHYVQNVTQPVMYEFEAATGKVTYLPNVSGAIMASSTDGSRVMFATWKPIPNTYESEVELTLMTSGPEGVTEEAIASKIRTYYISLTPARASADGSAFLFYAPPGSGGTLSSFNNGGFSQFYRYDVAGKELTCVSCPPPGVTPTGPAEMNLDRTPKTVQEVRLMSADGSRVFFASPDPLVAADVNGMPDVYEWENGHVYLISGGDAPVKSTYVDSSETGGDIFFVTPQSLVPNAEEGATTVYDARIPRPGDFPPPEKTPCSGSVCQGPPSVPELLVPGGSATFEGLGNIPPEAKPSIPPPVKKKCKKGSTRRKGKCVKTKANHKRKTNAKKVKQRGKRSHRHNRRGK